MKTFEPNKTITELGIDTTRKFVVVNGNGKLKKGEIFTLVEDDNSACPYFKNENGGLGCIWLKDLAYYEEEMREGDYIYVSDESEEDAIEQKHKRILLKKCNNGTLCIRVSYEDDYRNGNAFGIQKWNYAVPIPQTKTITLEVTKEQEKEINNILNK